MSLLHSPWVLIPLPYVSSLSLAYPGSMDKTHDQPAIRLGPTRVL